MATAKQKAAFNKISENHGNVSKTMREVGYAEITAETPKNLTDSIGWKELIEEHLPDSLLTKVHEEGLKANKIHGTENDFIEVPDYPTRHKYLETAYKIKNKVVDASIRFEVRKLIKLDE